MILSRKLGLLFVHIPKTAGTAISHVLREMDKDAIQHLPGFPHTQHYTAKDILDGTTRLQGLRLGDFLSFAVVRNPFERFGSLYHFIQTQERYKEPMQQIGSLTEFARLYESGDSWVEGLHSSKPQADFIWAPDGTQLVHHILRHEDLGSGLREISEKIGTAIVIERMNASDWNRQHRDLFTPEARDIVARRYARDLDVFDYTF